MGKDKKKSKHKHKHDKCVACCAPGEACGGSRCARRRKKRKRDSPSSSSSDSDSSSESGSVERKRAKAERLVRRSARASLAIRSALTLLLPRLSQAKKLSERLKRSGAVAGYTNECNPFGDTNLTDRCAPPERRSAQCSGPDVCLRLFPAARSFVWHKKLEKQILDGADVRELGLKAERQRQKERMACALSTLAPPRAALTLAPARHRPKSRR